MINFIRDQLPDEELLDISTNDQEYQETIREKRDRWVGRLRQAHAMQGDKTESGLLED